MTGSTIRLAAGTAAVEVAALAPDLFRVGMFLDGRPPDYTCEAIAKQDWALVDVERRIQGETVCLGTGSAAARLTLDPLRLRFEDASSRAFAVDDSALGMGCFPLQPD
ncbi:MAG: alpha-glucosidase, partial [Chloroflexi bacterium]|nr:alpha-glucosidase [Chloroflexota bacterium]